MSYTHSLVKRIQDRKLGINPDTNSRIKHLQRRLVLLSFQKGNHSVEYFNTLGKIEKLRKGLFLEH